jgi:hypothetical protein
MKFNKKQRTMHEKPNYLDLLIASFSEVGAYMELARTPKGREAVLMVAGVAMGVAINEASQADLDEVVEACAENSGIPASALAGHAKGVIDSFLVHQADKQRSTH